MLGVTTDLDVSELADVLGAFTRMNIRLPRVRRMGFTALSVLHTVATSGPKRLSDLAASEQVTQPAVTQLVSKLEAEGLLERRPDPSDGRAVLVHATAEGVAVVAGRRADRLAQLEQLTSQLSADDRRAIAAALAPLARLVALHARSAPEPEARGSRARSDGGRASIPLSIPPRGGEDG